MPENKNKNKVVLCILDGWGIAPQSDSNAIHIAKTYNFDHINLKYPSTSLNASEENVGLPPGQFGNSEVGHMNIGAGRIIYQDIMRINKSIEDESMSTNFKILNLKNNCKRIHITGLLSAGGVHAHEDHFFTMIDILNNNTNQLFLHCILDGRDSSPTSGIDSIKKLLKKIEDKPNINIVSMSGRYYAMDRDNRWDRIKKAYEVIINGSVHKSYENPLDSLKKSYSEALTDEFFLPTNFNHYSGVKENDGFLITNYRTDRVRELLTAIVDDDFNHFPRKERRKFREILGMVEYSRKLRKFIQSIFEPQLVDDTLGKVLSNNELKQLRIAETEKYAHVTYFFNGGVEEKFEGEDRVLIPSPRVQTYDKDPKMSAVQLTKEVIEKIFSKKYDFILINFANPDMVGHTGNIAATIEAVETVDKCLGHLIKATSDKEYTLIVTSDHGNADQMLDENLSPCTTHTTNVVPFIILTKENINLKKGCLADIAPTVLNVMNLKKPLLMTGKSLIK